MPLLVGVGFVVLLFVPVAFVVLAFQVIRRVGNYAITRPARELLFHGTTVGERYRAKNFIDTVVYRGGDAIGGWLVALISSGAGLLVSGAVLAMVWAGCGFWLGRRAGQLPRDDGEARDAEPGGPSGCCAGRFCRR